MDFKIYFCNDGVMRAKFSEDKPMIPVKFLQKNSPNSENDFKFWCHWWESNVYFEDGMTIGKFLLCLEPWAEFWSDLTGKRVDEYIKEVRKPFVIKEEKEKPMDWVGLFYYGESEADLEYKHDDEDDNFMKDINKWLNEEKNIRLTGQWNIHGAYKLSGFVTGEQEHYCIDYTPMNELANTPFFLSPRQWLCFPDWHIKRVLGNETNHIFKDDAFGICLVEGMRFMIGEKTHSLRGVVEGFFWWMHSNPTRRQEFVDDLKDRKDSLEELDFEENEEVESNVISMFKNEETTEVGGEEKKLKVKVVPGAFDSMIESFSREKEYWETMLELAKLDDEVVLKIGKTSLAVEPENRLFRNIVDPEDKLANPQPTEYKLV